MIDLKSRLLTCAELWATAHGKEGQAAPLSRLGKSVAGDANFFERVSNGGGVNLATLEKFARELADPTSWPDGVVREDARLFAHAVGVPVGATPKPVDSPAMAAEATGESGQMSGRSKAA